MKIEPTTPADSTPAPKPASSVAPAAKPSPGPAPSPGPRGRVFDVMRPGKAPASPTSRPVIAGHRPAAQAAQVRVSGIGASGTEPSLLDSHKKVDVKPSVSADAASPHDMPPVPPAPHAASTVPTPKAEPATPAPAASTPAVWTESPFQAHKDAETPPSPEPAETKAALAEPKPKKGKATEEEPEKPIDPAKLDDAAMEPEPPAPIPAEPEKPVPVTPIEDLHDPVHHVAAPNLDGQVVVSHHTTAPKGTGRLVALIVLMVLFALILVDILLDAGVLTTSVIPHTNFF